MTSPATPLAGKTVILPGSGESGRMDDRLRALGATLMPCPMMAVVAAPDTQSMDTFIASVSAGASGEENDRKIDDVILLTGEGVRRLVRRAEMLGKRDSFVAGLAGIRKITRGPKPAAALAEIGLTADVAPRVPTSVGIIGALRTVNLAGRRVAVQTHGETVVSDLLDALRDAGAVVSTVIAYTYAPAADDDKIRDVITRMQDGSAHAIAFTNGTQVDRLFDVADRRLWNHDLKTGLTRARVACIGPFVAEALTDRDVTVHLTLTPPYTVDHFCEALGGLLTEK